MSDRNAEGSGRKGWFWWPSRGPWALRVRPDLRLLPCWVITGATQDPA